jgi:hypothetical protein
MKRTEQQMIKLSEKNPSEVYECEDGRVIYAGAVFDSEQDLKIALKLAKSPVSRAIIKISNFFSK